jgi:hypothetical protein
MRTTIVFALVAALVGGCGTTLSSAGPFVTDLRFAGDKLEVWRCDLAYRVDDQTGATVVAVVAAIPFVALFAVLGGGKAGSWMSLGDGGGSSRRESVTAEACTKNVRPSDGGRS